MSWLISTAMVKHCESLRSLPGQAEESSVASCLDGAPYVPSSAIHTPQAYSCGDRTTGTWRRFRCGMTCGHLTGDRGEELLTSYRAAFRAKTFPLQEKGKVSKVPKADCGENLLELSTKHGLNSSSWKIRRSSHEGVLVESLRICLKWGSMRNGVVSQRKIAEHPINVKGSGLSHPTPCVSDHKGGVSRLANVKHRSYLMYWLHLKFSQGASTTYPNPELLEQVLGWPIGWTALEPLATDKFLSWRQSHGEFSVKNY